MGKGKPELALFAGGGGGGGGGGSGGGALLVTLTLQEPENAEAPPYPLLVANKTAGEIYNAIKAGVLVVYTFTDADSGDEYGGYISLVRINDGGYSISTPDGPTDGLNAQTANDYPSDFYV